MPGHDFNVTQGYVIASPTNLVQHDRGDLNGHEPDLVPGVQVGAVLEERLHARRLVVLGRQVQRRVAAVVRHVHVAPGQGRTGSRGSGGAM